MTKLRRTPAGVASEVRQTLKHDGSVAHAKGVQRFFKDEIQSHGWHTAALRRTAVRCRRELERDFGLTFVIKVADQLFSGCVLEEKVFAVFLLEKLTAEFGEREFKLFEVWLDRISSWADHDGLVHYLIGPMIVTEPARLANVFQWAASPDRWHRRAACVALVQGTRQRLFWAQIRRLSTTLLQDEDDMVRKGLGWLLRETAKANPTRAIPYLLKIRARAPRLVLRTACETLPGRDRARILGQRLQ